MCQTNFKEPEVGSVASSDKPDIYDQALPKNESKLFAPVRQWEKRLGFRRPLRWHQIAIFSAMHIIPAVWLTNYLYHGIYPKWQTVLFSYFYSLVGLFGVMAGMHRYYTHRTFKATKPMQILLIICYSIAGQNSIKRWVLDHRVHHKFSDTEVDPHNAKNGFFFSHMGWVMQQKHPRYFEEAAKIDMSDILNDPYIKFHARYFMLIKVSLCHVLPVFVPALGWGESWGYSILTQFFLRFLFVLHSTYSINSFAHTWGSKPYDKTIGSTESWIATFFSVGEGWHNYHHSFPWDYRAAEIPHFMNFTANTIEFFAKIGWIYDLKTASPELVKTVAAKRGEKSE